MMGSEGFEKNLPAVLDLEDEDFYEKKEETKEDGTQMLCFRLGEEFFSVEIHNVIEVVRVSGVTFLPSSPNCIAGICNLRGNILSVTDPKRLFDLGETGLTDRSRIVVISHNELETGLLVDEVLIVHEVPKSRINPPLATISKENSRHIKGEFKYREQLFTVVDTHEILEMSRNKPEKTVK